MSEIPPQHEIRLNEVGNSVQERHRRFAVRGMVATTCIILGMVVIIGVTHWSDIEQQFRTVIAMKNHSPGPAPEPININHFVLTVCMMVVVGWTLLMATIFFLIRRSDVRCSECARSLVLRWHWKKANEEGVCPFCGKPIRNFFSAPRS